MIRRIGKDIRVRWRILTNGEALPLEGRDLRLEVVTRFGRTEREFSIEDGNVVVFTLPGRVQLYLGEYTFTLWENWGKAGQTAVDSCGGIELVPTTCMEGGDSGLETETVELETSVLELGVSGDSAYEIWLSQGHEGTEEDFLAWLRQPAEDAAKEAQEAATRADSAAETANNTNSLVTAAEQQRKAAEIKRQEDTTAAISKAETAAQNAESSTEGMEELYKAVSTSEAERVKAEAQRQKVIAQVFAELYALSSVVDNAGHLKADVLDIANLPKVCGEDMYLTGEGAPAAPPTVPFQEYYDSSNNKFYRAKGVLPDTPSTGDWVALN